MLATALGIVGYLQLVATLQTFPFLLPVTAVTVTGYLSRHGPAVLTTVASGLFVQAMFRAQPKEDMVDHVQ